MTDYLVSTGMVQISFILLAALLPLDEFAALRVALVALSPLANVLAGVRTLMLAHLAGLHAVPGRALRRAKQMLVLVVGAGCAYGVRLALLPDRWGTEVFGVTWEDAESLVTVVVVGEVFRLSTFPAIDMLKVFASPTALVRTRAIATVGIVVGLLGGAAIAGPRGAVIALAVAYALASLIWWRAARRVASDVSAPAGGRPSTSRGRLASPLARSPLA